MSGEPHILHVLYNAVQSLEASVRALSEEQTEIKLATERIRADIGVMKNTLRHYDRLNNIVSELQRKVWLIGLVGGLISAVAVAVASGSVRSAIAANQTPTPVLPEKETIHGRP